jgi:hypothetical protein
MAAQLEQLEEAEEVRSAALSPHCPPAAQQQLQSHAQPASRAALSRSVGVSAANPPHHGARQLSGRSAGGRGRPTPGGSPGWSVHTDDPRHAAMPLLFSHSHEQFFSHDWGARPACQAFSSAVENTRRILDQVIATLPPESGAHAHRDTYVAAAKLDLAADK